MDIHKNARLTPLRREEMAQAVVEPPFPSPCRVNIWRVGKDRGALAWALQGRGRQRHGRPLVATGTQPERH